MILLVLSTDSASQDGWKSKGPLDKDNGRVFSVVLPSFHPEVNTFNGKLDALPTIIPIFTSAFVSSL